MKRALLCTLASVSLPLTLAAQDLVAIRAAKVHTLDGAPLDNAVILIQDGRIEAIGTDVEVPWNAKVIDAKDKVVLPTWILAHSEDGLGGGNNERMQNVPFLTVADALDPSSLAFEDGLRNGVAIANVMPGNNTLVAGRGLIARYVGRTVEEMTLRAESGLKMSLGGSEGNVVAKIRELRRVLDDAARTKADFERKKEEWQKEKDAGATKDEEFKEKIEDTKQPLIDLIDGKLTGYLYVPGPAELAEVARIKDRFQLKLVLVLGPRVHRAAAMVKSLGYPVVLEDSALEYRETDPETGDESTVSPAKALADAGVEFAISLNGSGRGATHYPFWQLATLLRNGLSRDLALRSLTTVPANILGLSDQVGALKKGATANLQIMTGDPFLATSWVETVIIEGQVVYERKNDARLSRLFEGKTEGTK
ncbi:MAG: amidohydrolase family protein [Planctomycetota bacterium]